MCQKRTASHPQGKAKKKKKTSESSQQIIPQSGDPKWKAHYQQLVYQCFVESRVIDWPTLERLSLADEV